MSLCLSTLIAFLLVCKVVLQMDNSKPGFSCLIFSWADLFDNQLSWLWTTTFQFPVFNMNIVIIRFHSMAMLLHTVSESSNSSYAFVQSLLLFQRCWRNAVLLWRLVVACLQSPVAWKSLSAGLLTRHAATTLLDSWFPASPGKTRQVVGGWCCRACKRDFRNSK